MRWVAAVALLMFATPALAETSLIKAYKKEFAVLEAEKQALKKRLASIKRKNRSSLGKAKAKVERLQSDISTIREEADALQKQLEETEKAAEGGEETAEMVADIVHRAAESLSRLGVTIDVPAKKPEKAIGALFDAATKLMKERSTVRVEEGRFFLTSGEQVDGKIVRLGAIAAYGVSEAGGVLVGRYLGAGKRQTAARAVRSARWLAVMAMGLCGAVFALGGQEIAGAFTKDPEVARIAGTLMFFAAAFQIFDAVAMAHLCALRNAGDTRFTLLVTTVAAWGLTVPFTVGFGIWLGWGAPGAWLGMTLEIAALAGLTAWRVRGLEDGRVGRLDLLLGEKAAAR